jgi:hypothetical protein
MPDIIGARCLTCGHIIRVSAKYGGQKAKCPQCAGIIVIPTPWDSTMGIVPDTELPQVAYEPAPEEAALPAEAEAADTEDAPVQTKTGGHRKAAGRTTGSRPVRRAPAGAGPATNRRPAPGRGSNTGLIVGLVVGAVVIAGVAVAIIATAGKKSKTDTTINVERRDPAKADQAAARQSESELYARLDEFVAAYNKCDSKKIAEFYAEAKRKDVEKYFKEHYENRWFRYENHAAPSIQAGRETAVMQLTFDRISLDRNKKEDEKGYRTEEKEQKRSINWAKVNGAWLITDNPEK